MRKYLDIPLTAFVAITLIVVMLWPLEAPAPEGSDKLVHFIAFAALAFPLARTGRLGLVSVLILASAFGGLIELIQPAFNRSADMGDWMADTIGVAIGIGCGLLYRRLRRH
jgi:VanZ family protein